MAELAAFLYRFPLVNLLLVLIATGAVGCGLIIVFMAQSLLRPPRLTDGKALYLLRRLGPDDLGLAYESLSIPVRDEATGRMMQMAAWWIPAEGPDPAERCAVLIHSYADAKVGALAWAPMWHELRCNLLIPDLRAHGESDGKYFTGGWFERHDLVQMINRVQTERPIHTRQIILFGASIGASVALATAEAMDAGRVAAVVLDTPIYSYVHAAKAHFDRAGMPGGWLVQSSVRLAEKLSHADFDRIRPIDLIPELRAPLMMVLPDRDAYFLAGDAERLADGFTTRCTPGGPDTAWRLNSRGHLMAIVDQPVEYRSRVRAFLKGAIRPLATEAIA